MCKATCLSERYEGLCHCSNLHPPASSPLLFSLAPVWHWVICERIYPHGQPLLLLAMATEIRFNSYGIPYIVEFGNVKFRARSSSRSRSCTSTLDDDYPTSTYERSVSSLGTVATASSETLAQPDDDGAGTAGLFIQFAASTRPYRKMSEGRVRRLKRRIAKAVMAAGMDSSPTSEKANPIEVARLSRLSCGSIESTDSVPEDDGAALFRGTYGQVMTALQAAGLITIPCRDVGVDSATRLGALFVANYTDHGTVEFSKLTLWA